MSMQAAAGHNAAAGRGPFSLAAAAKQPYSGSLCRAELPSGHLRKAVATKLMDVMDDGSFWHLAKILQQRGLIQISPGGF
eukprot:CAMPEP_0175512342 /NCGR_PEP_ID=MMETSP0096-20121207/12360_1 /TAXON_ID=311494 /ORGANISM="Alexandrium monilatum, Strain CCMP3105" /LENGTH=79 /DNA_ID=CAMNT_0016814557 /DNA_START=35 /DNA_END=271 /DNA_ORIENTATION=+